MLFTTGNRTTMPTPAEALPGRDHRLFTLSASHAVLETALEGPWPPDTEVLYVAMGCFWGAERIMWRLPGVVTTAVGYMGGFTANPTYEECCTGRTGHAETVLVAYDRSAIAPEIILKAFWENHDPTQGNRQGNDVGTAYRSAIFWTTPVQHSAVIATHAAFQAELTRVGAGRVTTQELPADEAGPFWYAEDYHQQYLHKNPAGYCNHGANGLTCPIGVANLPAQAEVNLPAQTIH